MRSRDLIFLSEGHRTKGMGHSSMSLGAGREEGLDRREN